MYVCVCITWLTITEDDKVNPSEVGLSRVHGLLLQVVAE